MLKELYFRDSTDSRFNDKKLEEDNSKECLLNKIRMILYSNRGEVLGAPEIGLNLEEHLFDFNAPLEFIRTKFYAQLSKYVPEVKDYKIDIDFDVVQGISSKTVNIYIQINNRVEIGLSLN